MQEELCSFGFVSSEVHVLLVVGAGFDLSLCQNLRECISDALDSAIRDDFGTEDNSGRPMTEPEVELVGPELTRKIQHATPSQIEALAAWLDAQHRMQSGEIDSTTEELWLPCD
jgi:hypothetical protein